MIYRGPMTLETAVILTRRFYRRISSLTAQEEEQLNKADLVINAAVEMHKARCKLADGEEAVIAPLTDEFMDWEEAFDELRALERGEDGE